MRDLGLWYNEDGSLWVAAWSQWAVDPNGVYAPDPNDPNTAYQLLAAREFRGGGMGRYPVRDIDVSDPNQFTIMGPTVWTDRLGGAAYGDFETDYLADPNDPNAVVLTTTERSRYHGHARGENTAPAGSPESWTTRFEQRDMLGSLTQQTDPNGVFEFDFGYSAFGDLLATFWDLGGPLDPNTGNEPNQPPPSRQMYAGGWQYESDLLYLYGTDPTLPPITLQHVGHRWYQPEIGRFVQRDPIGLGGGLNVYVYCGSNPSTGVDPLGLWNVMKWMYTGDGNAPDWVYDEAVNGLGQEWYEHNPLRGGYAGAGGSVGIAPPHGLYGPRVSGTATILCTWTVDNGGSALGAAGVVADSGEGTPGLGAGVWGEGRENGDLAGGAYFSVGGHSPGGSMIQSTSGNMLLGLNLGIFRFGIIVNPGRM